MQEAPYILRSGTFGAVFGQGAGVVAFGEARAGVVTDQAVVVVERRG